MKIVDIDSWPNLNWQTVHPLIDQALNAVQADPSVAVVLDDGDLLVLPNRDWDTLEGRMRDLAKSRGFRITLSQRYEYDGRMIGKNEARKLPEGVVGLPSFLWVRAKPKK